MKKIAAFLLLLLPATAELIAQPITITYKESDEDIHNPERGFYIPAGTKASRFIALDAAQLKRYRHEDQQPRSASYSAKVTLLYRGYELDIFKNRPLSDSFLTDLQKDLDAIRASGLKLVLRFAYTNSTNSGNCPDEYKICPPYGDAPVHVVMNHIKQLKPLLRKNADIIAVLQEGFIGIWGENYFTDYWGDASNNGAGVIVDSSWGHRNFLLKALLDALPDDRMVQVRTPQIKQRFEYGPKVPVMSAPRMLKERQWGKYLTRIGFHNDCFLASADDYGTFYDYGNSSSKKDTANKRLRNYFIIESRYVAVGGETCDDAFSPQNDCEPGGHAEKEMESMHYSYLNAAYNNQVNNDWDSLGCMKRIKQRLGYRLVVRDAKLPASVNRCGRMAIQLTIENTGFAAPYNPRPVQLILRNKQTGAVHTCTIDATVQAWFPGIIRLDQQIRLPAGISAGQYELLLNLPDKYETLQNNPDYSIRLANTDCWEPNTGYNKLNHDITVK